MDLLKPCPFCGNAPEIQKDSRWPKWSKSQYPKKAWEVICINFDCVIYRADRVYFLRRRDAIDAWNRRV